MNNFHDLEKSLIQSTKLNIEHNNYVKSKQNETICC